MTEKHRIVADGRERVRETSDYAQQCKEIRRAVAERYRPEIERAGLFQKLVLYVRRRRELERELEKLAPRTGSYLRPSLTP